MSNQENESNKVNDPNQPDTTIVVTGKKRKGIIVTCAVAVAVLLAVGAVLLLTLPRSVEAKAVQEKLELGSRYLSELNYEQAVAVYKAALEIDPKCTDAYLGLAEVYTALGEYEKAEEILDIAQEKVEKKQDLRRISDKKTEVGDRKARTPEPTSTPTPEPTPTPTPTPTPEPTSTPTPTPEPTSTPTPTPTPTSTPTPTPTPTSTPTPMPTPPGSLSTPTQISKAEIGATVTFGSYEQDNDLTNGAEAIEWIVLDKQDGKVLLLSKYALDCKPYHEVWTYVTWETCTLRKWLNEEFFVTAFNEKEQSYIAETLVKNEDNPYWDTEGGNDTLDKVFLLSIGEVTTYFDPDPDAYDPARRAKVTEYAKAQGGWAYSEAEYGWYGTTEYDGNGWWWLRSPGINSDIAARVLVDGGVHQLGNGVGYYHDVVRPAFWIAP